MKVVPDQGHYCNMEFLFTAASWCPPESEDAQAAEFQQVEADAKFMVSAQGITTGTKAA